MGELKPATVNIVRILHRSPKYDVGYIGLGDDSQLYLWTKNGNWVALRSEL